MNWNSRFAQRTQCMKRTAVRELLKITSRPEIISFAGGLPAAELFPVARVKEAVQKVLERKGAQSLQYSETEGLPALRDWIAAHLSRGQLKLRRENVLVTSGAQQALDLIGRVFLDSGDVVAVENPTYLALLSAWRPFGARFLAAPSDADGVDVDALGQILGAHRPKLTYLVPNFQNPQGTTLTAPRRAKLMELLREHDALVVEDNPYGDLRYSGETLPNLLEFDAAAPLTQGLQGRVIYTGTFSKVLMPGLRVGWVVAAPEVIEKLVQAKQAADLHSSTLCQHIALQLLEEGFLHNFVPLLQNAYRQRRDLMLAALEQHFTGKASWTRPDGGMFLLVTLPKEINTSALFSKALQLGVAYVPGEEFHLDGQGTNTMRLNFSNARPEQIPPGLTRLAQVI